MNDEIDTIPWFSKTFSKSRSLSSSAAWRFGWWCMREDGHCRSYFTFARTEGFADQLPHKSGSIFMPPHGWEALRYVTGKRKLTFLEVVVCRPLEKPNFKLETYLRTQEKRIQGGTVRCSNPRQHHVNWSQQRRHRCANICACAYTNWDHAAQHLIG